MRATKHFTGALAIAALLALSPTVAAGPAQIVGTYLEATADLLGEGSVLEPGDVSEGFVHLTFCYDFGGLNLLGGEFLLTLDVVSAPAWLDARNVGGNERYYKPPTGPVLNPDCDWADHFHLRLTAALDAPRGETGTVVFQVSADAVGDVGTYQTPDDVVTQGTITVAP